MPAATPARCWRSSAWASRDLRRWSGALSAGGGFTDRRARSVPSRSARPASSRRRRHSEVHRSTTGCAAKPWARASRANACVMRDSVVPRCDRRVVDDVRLLLCLEACRPRRRRSCVLFDARHASALEDRIVATIERKADLRGAESPVACFAVIDHHALEGGTPASPTCRLAATALDEHAAAADETRSRRASGARPRGRLPAQPRRCARLERFADRGSRTARHQATASCSTFVSAATSASPANGLGSPSRPPRASHEPAKTRPFLRRIRRGRSRARSRAISRCCAARRARPGRSAARRAGGGAGSGSGRRSSRSRSRPRPAWRVWSRPPEVTLVTVAWRDVGAPPVLLSASGYLKAHRQITREQQGAGQDRRDGGRREPARGQGRPDRAARERRGARAARARGRASTPTQCASSSASRACAAAARRRRPQLDRAQTREQVARAQRDLARVALDNREIRAPIDGTVIRKIRDVGEFLTIGVTAEGDPGTAVVTLADLSAIEVDARRRRERDPQGRARRDRARHARGDAAPALPRRRDRDRRDGRPPEGRGAGEGADPRARPRAAARDVGEGELPRRASRPARSRCCARCPRARSWRAASARVVFTVDDEPRHGRARDGPRPRRRLLRARRGARGGHAARRAPARAPARRRRGAARRRERRERRRPRSSRSAASTSRTGAARAKCPCSPTSRSTSRAASSSR